MRSRATASESSSYRHPLCSNRLRDSYSPRSYPGNHRKRRYGSSARRLSRCGQLHRQPLCAPPSVIGVGVASNRGGTTNSQRGGSIVAGRRGAVHPGYQQDQHCAQARLQFTRIYHVVHVTNQMQSNQQNQHRAPFFCKRGILSEGSWCLKEAAPAQAGSLLLIALR
jgi:hypothetical protein